MCWADLGVAAGLPQAEQRVQDTLLLLLVEAPGALWSVFAGCQSPLQVFGYHPRHSCCATLHDGVVTMCDSPNMSRTQGFLGTILAASSASHVLQQNATARCTAMWIGPC